MGSLDIGRRCGGLVQSLGRLLSLTCVLAACVPAGLAPRGACPGPAAPQAPAVAERPRSTAVVSAVHSLAHPDVLSIDDIPESCRGKYVKDGDLAVPIVGVATKVISISSLDLAEGTFKADINVNVAWVGEKDDAPEIQFYNIAEEIEREQAASKKGSDDGVTKWSFYYRVRIRGVFRQAYELHRFPFDTQHLRVDVRLKSSCKLVPLRWGLGGEAFTYDRRAVHDEFALVGATVAHTYLPSYKFGRLDGYDPEASIIFSVLRKPLYWVVSYGAVVSAVSSLMATTYALPAEDIGDRLGVAMTLVLTMTATLYLMQEKLPNVSYCTLLDYHILVCCVVLMALTMEIGTTTVVGADKKSELEKRWLKPVGGLWIAYHVGLLVWISMQQLC